MRWRSCRWQHSARTREKKRLGRIALRSSPTRPRSSASRQEGGPSWRPKEPRRDSLGEFAFALVRRHLGLSAAGPASFRTMVRSCRTRQRRKCERLAWEFASLGTYFYWVWSDEDFVGHLMEVAESCHLGRWQVFHFRIRLPVNDATTPWLGYISSVALLDQKTRWTCYVDPPGGSNR